MSDGKIKKDKKSKGFLKEIAEKIVKANTFVNDYKRLGITPAMPMNAYINIANSMYTKGFFKEAENLLQTAICFPTKTSNALINLGIVKQTTGNFDEAIQFYKSAYEKDKTNAKALGLWGNCLAMTGKPDEAIKKYEQAIKINEKDADIYLSWGALLIKQKKYSDAKDKLNKAIKYNTKDARPMYMLAIVEIETGDYDSALERLLNIVSVTENNFEALHNIAYVYFKKGDYDNAISYAKQVLSIFRNKVEKYLLLGDIYAIKNMEKESLQFYEMAEMNGLHTFFLYLSWAVSLQKFNHHNTAIDKLLKANNCLKNKNVDEVYARLALSYYKIGQTEKSIENLNTALKINPTNYMANSVAAEINVDSGNYERALEYLDTCKEDFVNKGFNYSLRAQCYEHLGKEEEARGLFEKALEYMPNKKEIYIAYTKYLIKQGDFETAKKKLKGYGDNTDNLELLNLYFLVMYNLAKQGGYKYNIEKALEIAEKIKKIDADSFVYGNETAELKELLRTNG